MKLNRFWGLLPALLLSTTIALGAAAAGGDGRRTTANLPYRFPQGDPSGNNWMLFNGGRIVQQGNMPFCGDAASLIVNGQSIQSNAQTATLESTGEVILENLRAGQLSVTRRIFQLDDGTMRITDIIRNPRSEELTASITISFNINFGVQATRTISDPKKAERPLAMVITDSQNRNLVSSFAGRNSKITPTINAPPNNNQVQAIFEMKIPAGKERAIVHFHQFAASADQADKIASQLREPRTIANLPPEIRRILANYPVATSQLDDIELLRGTTTDVVELNSSDQLRGDLLVAQWDMDTAFGKLQIPGDQVAGLIVTTGPQPRQLLVTTDGEMIGGKLTLGALDLQTSSGQKLSLPISQISRVGRRSALPAEGEPRKLLPMIHLRTGDRLAVNLPQQPLRFATRFGTLDIAPATIAMLDLQPEQSPVHIISLTDGSRFSGLLLSDALDVSLTRGPKVSLPSASIRRLAFAPDPDDVAEPAATLRLTGDDVLVVTLAPKIVVATTYASVTINGPEVKRISRVKDTPEDLQFALWDDSVISGRLAQPYLECTLAGGAAARVPAGAIEMYQCLAPQPSATAMEQVKRLVGELNADDWKQRERAEVQLTSMGDAIAPILKQMRTDQPPEAQERIDSILKQFAKPGSNKPSATPTPRVMIRGVVR